MAISESLLPEFDQEMAGVRTTLERVPEDKFDWKPHPKSLSMSVLAGHIANLPSWGTLTVNQDELDTAPGGKPMPGPPPPASTAELVATFDRTCAEARAAIAGTSDAELMKPWTLLSNGTKLFSLTKVAVLRSIVLNHLIHHRAQLGVYLRINDVASPRSTGRRPTRPGPGSEGNRGALPVREASGARPRAGTGVGGGVGARRSTSMRASSRYQLSVDVEMTSLPRQQRVLYSVGPDGPGEPAASRREEGTPPRRAALHGRRRRLRPDSGRRRAAEPGRRAPAAEPRRPEPRGQRLRLTEPANRAAVLVVVPASGLTGASLLRRSAGVAAWENCLGDSPNTLSVESVTAWIAAGAQWCGPMALRSCTWWRVTAMPALLGGGADVMARDADGETPLHEAVWNEVNVVEARLVAGARVCGGARSRLSVIAILLRAAGRNRSFLCRIHPEHVQEGRI